MMSSAVHRILHSNAPRRRNVTVSALFHCRNSTPPLSQRCLVSFARTWQRSDDSNNHPVSAIGTNGHLHHPLGRQLPVTCLSLNKRRYFASLANGTDLPYHIVVGMPALSPTMSSGTISKWNVKEGDTFSAGDSLAVIETDKASMDFEAQDDGIVAKLLVSAGGGVELEVGSAIMVTVEEADHVGAFANFVSPSGAASASSTASVSTTDTTTETAAATTTFASVTPPQSTPAKDLPYHIVVGMPALSPTMDAGTISKWNLAVGDSFSAGDSIAVIETDKASMDFEAQDDGVVAKLLVDAGAGESINVGTPIMVTVEDASDVPAFKDFVLGGESTSPQSQSKPAMEASKPVPVVPTPPVLTITAPTTTTAAPPAHSTPPSAAVISGATALSHAISAGSSSWGRLAAEKSPLAKALATNQQRYIDKYGPTGHIPI